MIMWSSGVKKDFLNAELTVAPIGIAIAISIGKKLTRITAWSASLKSPIVRRIISN